MLQQHCVRAHGLHRDSCTSFPSLTGSPASLMPCPQGRSVLPLPCPPQRTRAERPEPRGALGRAAGTCVGLGCCQPAALGASPGLAIAVACMHAVKPACAASLPTAAPPLPSSCPTPRCAPAKLWRWWAPAAAASPPSSSWWNDSTHPTRGGSWVFGECNNPACWCHIPASKVLWCSPPAMPGTADPRHAPPTLPPSHLGRCVLIDDRPVGDYDRKWLKQRVALVSQEPVLYARSIRR